MALPPPNVTLGDGENPSVPGHKPKTKPPHRTHNFSPNRSTHRNPAPTKPKRAVCHKRLRVPTRMDGYLRGHSLPPYRSESTDRPPSAPPPCTHRRATSLNSAPDQSDALRRNETTRSPASGQPESEMLGQPRSRKSIPAPRDASSPSHNSHTTSRSSERPLQTSRMLHPYSAFTCRFFHKYKSSRRIIPFTSSTTCLPESVYMKSAT